MPATATPDRLQGMVATSRASKGTLGFICWFSVPNEDVSMRKLNRAWSLAGLDRTPLPKDAKAVNSFKRAVREQDGIHRDEIEGTVTETDVRLVLEDSSAVVYQVTRVARDLSEQVVLYERALRVWFVKSTDEIGFKSLGDLKRREVLPIMEAVQTAYDAASKTVPGAKVRTLVRNYIKDDPDEKDQMVGLSGESMRGKAGGVYFVAAKHQDQLEALAEMLNELYVPHGRAYLYMVPLADGASEREMVRRRHVMNSIKEMEAAMSEAAKLVREDRERAVREDVRQHHFRKLERMRRRVAQYETLLKEEQDDVRTHMELAQKQLHKLLGS